MKNKTKRRPTKGSPAVNSGSPKYMSVFKFACGHKVMGLIRPEVCPICGVCESCAELNYPEVN